jgi:hypothetical protein
VNCTGIRVLAEDGVRHIDAPRHGITGSFRAEISIFAIPLQRELGLTSKRRVTSIARALIPIITLRDIDERVHAAGSWGTGIDGAGIVIIAFKGLALDAGAVHAPLKLSACITIVAIEPASRGTAALFTQVIDRAAVPIVTGIAVVVLRNAPLQRAGVEGARVGVIAELLHPA